ncbi:MAG: SDR family oxidoreductase [Spirochaetes bacterium]|nr:SDR family oxidoreductase [Spirochaetota bacterium]
MKGHKPLFDTLPNALKQFVLQGKTALVTGSYRGLGFVMAKALAEVGARVVVNGRNSEGVNRAVEALLKDGFDAHGVPFDVTVEEEVERGIAKIEERIGRIDILVNNAGIQRRVPLIETPMGTWEEVLRTNLTGPFLTTKIVGKRMIERKNGKIVHVCSLASFVGRKGIGPYTVAKGGLKLLTQAMCAEWAEHNIQVNGIAPGFFLTDLTRPLREDPEFNAYVEHRTPSRRWGNPSELTGVLLLLVSSAGDFINGQVIVVDGGILAVM